MKTLQARRSANQINPTVTDFDLRKDAVSIQTEKPMAIPSIHSLVSPGQRTTAARGAEGIEQPAPYTRSSLGTQKAALHAQETAATSDKREQPLSFTRSEADGNRLKKVAYVGGHAFMNGVRVVFGQTPHPPKPLRVRS